MDNPIYSLYINNKDKCKQKQTISLKEKRNNPLTMVRRKENGYGKFSCY